MLIKDRIKTEEQVHFGSKGKNKTGEVCHLFNKGKYSYGLNCKFEHKCSVKKCGKYGHGVHICQKRDDDRDELKFYKSDLGHDKNSWKQTLIEVIVNLNLPCFISFS